MKIRKDDIGKSVLVKFDDVGRIEGMLIDIVEHSVPHNFKEAKVFFPNDKTIDDVEFCQIVEIGKRVQINIP